MEGPVYIIDEVRKVVAKVNTKLRPTLGKEVYYMPGHPLEILQRLQAMTQSPVHFNKKYPLICLFTDITVTKARPGIYGTAPLRIVIATLTEQNYDAEQRLEKNFKPTLQPIKTELLKQLFRHPQFTFETEMLYKETERYYWGRQGLYGNEGNIFSDFIDCIELEDVGITVREFNC